MRLQELLHDDFIQSTGWLRRWHPNTHRLKDRRFRRMSGLPVRNNDDTVLSTWIEQVAEVDDSACEGNRKRTYTNTLFSSLKVRRDNAVNIAAAGRTRWKIETETFNCLNPTYTAQLLDCCTPFGAESTQ